MRHLGRMVSQERPTKKGGFGTFYSALTSVSQGSLSERSLWLHTSVSDLRFSTVVEIINVQVIFHDSSESQTKTVREGNTWVRILATVYLEIGRALGVTVPKWVSYQIGGLH